MVLIIGLLRTLFNDNFVLYYRNLFIGIVQSRSWWTRYASHSRSATSIACVNLVQNRKSCDRNAPDSTRTYMLPSERECCSSRGTVHRICSATLSSTFLLASSSCSSQSRRVPRSGSVALLLLLLDRSHRLRYRRSHHRYHFL